MKNNIDHDTQGREIVITRYFDAGRERVFEAMIDPQQVVKWWGPNGFTTTIHEMNVCVGGVWKHTMHGPDGTDYPNKSIFTEVIKPERIAYKHAGGAEEHDGACFVASWDFAEEAGKTKLTLRMVFKTSAERDRTVEQYQAIEGGKQTLGRLDEHLETMGKISSGGEDVVIIRSFNASRERVWKAWTDPEQIRKWWAPKIFFSPACKVDFRIGGKWLFCMQSDRGPEHWKRGMWATGEYKEIVPFEKIVFTDSFADEKGNVVPSTYYEMEGCPLEMIVTVTFEELSENRTRMTMKHQLLPKDHRQGAGLGWNESFDKLADSLTGVIIERVFKVAPQVLWKALTDKEQMRQWYFDLSDFKAEVGFEFEFSASCREDKVYRHLCKVTEVIQGKKIAYSWRYDGYEGNSVVSFELFEEDGGTCLKLTHAGLASFPKSNADLDKKNFLAGWTEIIGESLKFFLEK